MASGDELTKQLMQTGQLVHPARVPVTLLGISENSGLQTIDKAHPLPVTGNTDAFGRLRISEPLTLFDSSHRFSDNDLWNQKITGTASSVFNQDAGLVELNIGTTAGDEIIRETNKVFSYQPGKSLLVLSTFVFDTPKTNLRQRCGYFGAANGMYFEVVDNTVNFVERSSVTGSVLETRSAQANWNVDKLDGKGPSGLTLDSSKAQILWMDIEWLGLGTVRMGFVINGIFVHCHSFHHANIIEGTYITTASLPLRQEITNIGNTAEPSMTKQICSSVISEGGYQLRGRQQAISTDIATPYVLSLADIYYPVISLQLKSTRLDAITILTAASLLGLDNGAYNWKIVAGGTVTGGSWASAGDHSAVEYNTTATAITGGKILASGWLSTSNQSAGSIDLLKEALFKFQMERNTFTSTPESISLTVGCNTASADVYASLDWEEITR